MTITDAPPATRPAVLLHCGALPAARVERRVKTVISTLPADVTVWVTVLAPVRFTTATARRAKPIVITDGGTGLVVDLLGRGSGLVVLPYEAVVGNGWYEDVLTRWDCNPAEVGVAVCGSAHVMAYPPGVTSLDAPRQPWPPVNGVTTRAPSGQAPASARSSLSAVLIVKDEERVIASCLAALAPLVDETVVYDTGSTDSTVALARAAGAVVIDGYWDDDFGAARTRALSHATGDWVLSVDADEEAVADRAALRDFIDYSPFKAHLVRVISVSFDSAEDGVETSGPRLFRREGAAWSGVLHEQPVSHDGEPIAHGLGQPPLKLMHVGYTSTAMHTKRGRNTQILERALATAGSPVRDRADLQAHLVRSYVADGRVAEALELAAELLSSPAVRANMLLVARVVVPHLLAQRVHEEAAVWIEVARDARESPGQCAIWQSALLVAENDLAEASTVLRAHLGSRGGVDFWNTPCEPAAVTMALAEVEMLRDETTSALDLLAEALRDHPETISLRGLLSVMHGTGKTMGDLIAVSPPAFIRRSLRDILHMSPDFALRWCAALLEAFPDDASPLVAGSVVATRSGWADAAEWETHARRRQLLGVHPLRDFADDLRNALPERVLAWALVWQAFGDDDAEGNAQSLLDIADPGSLARAEDLLRRHVPTALEPA